MANSHGKDGGVLRFLWQDDEGGSRGSVELAGRPALWDLYALPQQGGWAAHVRCVWAASEPVAGPFPGREQAKAAAEAYVRGLPAYLTRLYGEAA